MKISLEEGEVALSSCSKSLFKGFHGMAVLTVYLRIQDELHGSQLWNVVFLHTEFYLFGLRSLEKWYSPYSRILLKALLMI